MTSEILKFSVIRARCRGQKAVGEPCQDAFSFHDSPAGLVAAVADGLGSRPRSHLGARIFCRAVLDCCRPKAALLERTALAEALGRKIPEAWRERIIGPDRSENIGDYAATGGFVFIRKSAGEVISGRKGDVIVASESDGGPAGEVFPPFEKDFLNDTTALGEAEEDEMETRTLTFQNSFAFLLATDGIGDELDRDRFGDLFQYLKDNYPGGRPGRGHNLLRQDIEKTFGPKNHDDQTLIFGWGQR